MSMTEDEKTHVIAAHRIAAEVAQIAADPEMSKRFEPDARREVTLARAVLVLARELRGSDWRAWSDAERLAFVQALDYCHYCGALDPRCQCNNDE